LAAILYMSAPVYLEFEYHGIMTILFVLNSREFDSISDSNNCFDLMESGEFMISSDSGSNSVERDLVCDPAPKLLKERWSMKRGST
jgi:hypothetical protein